MTARSWRELAACLDVVSADYDPFFADSAELQAQAIAICATCLVRDDCLTFTRPMGGRPSPSEPRKEVARMWRDRDRYPDHQYVPDTFWLLVAVLLFAYHDRQRTLPQPRPG